jgi:hypothetical protein
MLRGHRVSTCTCIVRCAAFDGKCTSGLRIAELGGIELVTGERDRLGAGRDRAIGSEAAITEIAIVLGGLNVATAAAGSSVSGRMSVASWRPVSLDVTLVDLDANTAADDCVEQGGPASTLNFLTFGCSTGCVRGENSDGQRRTLPDAIRGMPSLAGFGAERSRSLGPEISGAHLAHDCRSN